MRRARKVAALAAAIALPRWDRHMRSAARTRPATQASSIPTATPVRAKTTTRTAPARI